jgi:hypothetical protein
VGSGILPSIPPLSTLVNGSDEIFKGVANATCGTSQNDRGSGTAADWSRG